MMPQNENAMPPESSWYAATPLFKYSAIVVFVTFPFIGAWIGYTYAPEKIVEIERATQQQLLTNISQTNDKDLSAGTSRVTIESRPLNPSGGLYPQIHDYVFENGFYTVSFSYPLGIDANDNYHIPQRNLSVWFERHVNDGTEIGISENFLTLEVFNKEYCSEARCELVAIKTVDLNGETWEYLGSHKYCDIGECWGSAHVYRQTVGDFVEYLSADVALDGPQIQSDEALSKILSSLMIQVNKK